MRLPSGSAQLLALYFHPTEKRKCGRINPRTRRRKRARSAPMRNGKSGEAYNLSPVATVHGMSRILPRKYP